MHGSSVDNDAHSGDALPRQQSSPPAIDLKDPSLYFNRELSWLEFNRRVLDEAQDPRHPLLERVKFLAIFSSNLDEFFMIRVSGLKDQIAAGVTDRAAGRHDARPSSWRRSAARALPMLREQRPLLLRRDHARSWPRRASTSSHYDQLTPEEQDQLREYFQAEVLPVVTPLAFDPGRPFPHISNLSLNLAVTVRGPDGEQHFARIKVPTSLPRLVPVEPGRRLVWLEEVIAGNLGLLFPGHEIVEATRSTSSATPTWKSRRTRRRTCWRPSSRGCGSASSGRWCAWRWMRRCLRRW